MITKDLLDAAIQAYHKEHKPANLGITCEECRELGEAMYDSQEWRQVEADWVKIVVTADPMEFVHSLRMAMKFSIGVGVRLERLGRRRVQ